MTFKETLVFYGVNLEELQVLMDSKEDENLEFKEAKGDFSRTLLIKYCAALANERGGKIILGVTNKHPRKIVGCGTFRNVDETKKVLLDTLH